MMAYMINRIHTNEYRGHCNNYELLLPTYHYSGKGVVKYRIQQNTTACDCCDDLFVRYVLPNDGLMTDSNEI